MREYVDELLEHWDDAYWRADHPEVIAVAIALLTGAIGLAFTWLEVRMSQNRQLPKVSDV